MKRVNRKLYEGEKSELLHGVFGPRWKKLDWFTKKHVLNVIRKWDRYTDYVAINKIGWDNEEDWGKLSEVTTEVAMFDLYNGKDTGELLGHLFESSIEGYSIRYVSTDPLVGMYLERKTGLETNIDDEVVSVMLEYTKNKIS